MFQDQPEKGRGTKIRVRKAARSRPETRCCLTSAGVQGVLRPAGSLQEIRGRLKD